MPTASGRVKVERTRVPGPPVTFVTNVTIEGSRLGDGTVTFEPCPVEWVDFFTALVGKSAMVDYTIGPPLTINKVTA